MSKINISNLTFCYDGSYDDVFKNVSLCIDTDWKLGICGRNGKGKTTLLRLLMGKHQYQGSISSDVRFAYYPLEDYDANELTVNVLEAVADNAPLWQIKKELFKLELDDGILYRPFYTLSGGEQTKVLIAGLFLQNDSFLLIDEPTNHLDTNSRQVLARYLKAQKGFAVVSHDRSLLDECVNHILSINKSDITIQKGNFSDWFLNKQHQDNFEKAKNEKLVSEINRLKTAAKQKSDWSVLAEKEKTGSGPCDRGYIGHKAAKVMKTAKAIQKRQQDALQEKSNLLKNIEQVDELKINPLNYHSDTLLSLNGVSIFYDSCCAVRDLSLTLKKGQRLCLQGANGSGKSSIIKLLCDKENFLNKHNVVYTDIKIGSNLLVSYVPQDESFLSGDLSTFAQQQQIDQTLFKSILHKLDFCKIQFEKDIKSFSKGQKKKVLIAASLSKRAHVYIWDEPLNYIDVFSRIQIEQLLLHYKPTMVFVEHDKTFCDNIATLKILL